jgi:hypothetical protein
MGMVHGVDFLCLGFWRFGNLGSGDGLICDAVRLVSELVGEKIGEWWCLCKLEFVCDL